LVNELSAAGLDLAQASAAVVAGIFAGKHGDVTIRLGRHVTGECQRGYENPAPYLTIGVDVGDLMDEEMAAPDLDLEALVA
jgi:hypothetical protein